MESRRAFVGRGIKIAAYTPGAVSAGRDADMNPIGIGKALVESGVLGASVGGTVKTIDTLLQKNGVLLQPLAESVNQSTRRSLIKTAADGTWRSLSTTAVTIFLRTLK